MSVELLLKDLVEVYCRLFDHRPAIKAEVSFFVREFEEKRGNHAEMRLQKSLEYCREMDEKLMPACIGHLSTSLPLLKTSASEAIESCHNIEQNELNPDKSDWLNKQRQQRKAEWTAYLDKMCERTAAIDQEFEDEVKRVENYYSDLGDGGGEKFGTSNATKT